MAAAIYTEHESGTDSGWVHPHNGYYAGDFSSPRYDTEPAAWSSLVPSFDAA